MTGLEKLVGNDGTSNDLLSASSQGSLYSDVLFPWISSVNGWSGKWHIALLFAVLGLLGSLATVYLADFDYMPRVGDGATMLQYSGELAVAKEEEARAGAELDRLDDGASPDIHTAKLQKRRLAQEKVDKAELAMNRLRKSIVLLKIPIFVVLGGAFAVLLAENGLQALLIGALWPFVLAGIGIKGTAEQRTQVVRDLASSAVQFVRDDVDTLKARLRDAEINLQESESGRQDLLKALRKAVVSK